LSPIAGPTNWHCEVPQESVAYGSELDVFPPGERAPNVLQYNNPPEEGVVVTSSGDAPGLVAIFVCRLYHRASVGLNYFGCPKLNPVPKKEVDRYDFLGSSSTAGGTVRFLDPPGVTGTGDLSGGAYPVIGALSWTSTGNNGFDAAVKVSCAMPPTDAAECDSIVNAFLQSAWGIAAPAIPAALNG
jgi:hypothetical protein